jgi:hypothetical protein
MKKSKNHIIIELYSKYSGGLFGWYESAVRILRSGQLIDDSDPCVRCIDCRTKPCRYHRLRISLQGPYLPNIINSQKRRDLIQAVIERLRGLGVDNSWPIKVIGETASAKIVFDNSPTARLKAKYDGGPTNMSYVLNTGDTKVLPRKLCRLVEGRIRNALGSRKNPNKA